MMLRLQSYIVFFTFRESADGYCESWKIILQQYNKINFDDGYANKRGKFLAVYKEAAFSRPPRCQTQRGPQSDLTLFRFSYQYNNGNITQMKLELNHLRFDSM